MRFVRQLRGFVFACNVERGFGSTALSDSMTARSIRFWSSRTLPGQWYATNAFIVGSGISSMCFPMRRANTATTFTPRQATSLRKLVGKLELESGFGSSLVLIFLLSRNNYDQAMAACAVVRLQISEIPDQCLNASNIQTAINTSPDIPTANMDMWLGQDFLIPRCSLTS
jgi:hypothetical protein